MRDDRDRQISQVQTLSTEIVKFKDSSEKSGSELNNLTMKTKELEVGFFVGFRFGNILFLLRRHERGYDFPVQTKCTFQDNHIMELQEKLTFAENKLEVT